MTPEDSTNSQLANLQQRWEEDPSPHHSLELADLYRQRDQLAEALPVLEKGLVAHPGHISLRVALGRYRLEGGDAGGAEEVLLEVVDKDPAHLVANKLLVRAYVALGDRLRAADRLDLYTVLSDGDPDLEALGAAVAASGPAKIAAEPVGEPFSPAAAPDASIDLRSVRPPGRRVLVGALDRSPFAGLLSASLEASSLAGLFGSSGETAEEIAEEAAEDVAEEVAAAPPEEVAKPPSTVEDMLPELIDSLIEQESEPEEPPSPEESKAEMPPHEVDGGSGATATLGALYLAQDHLDDAQTTFEQVLERDPADAEARAGLAEVTRRRADDEERKARKAAAASQSGKKIELLESYLSRIRQAADRLSA